MATFPAYVFTNQNWQYWTQCIFSITCKAAAAAGQANLIKQQEELERKAAELEQKEQELQNRTAGRALNTGEKLFYFATIRTDTTTADINQYVNFSVWQLKRTTGHLSPISPLSSPASIRTLRRKSLRSTAGSARECITSGCVRTTAWRMSSILSHNNVGCFLTWY